MRAAVNMSLGGGKFANACDGTQPGDRGYLHLSCPWFGAWGSGWPPFIVRSCLAARLSRG